MTAPALDDDLGLTRGVEDRAVEQFVAKPGAELHALYRLSDQPAPNLQPLYNIAPTDLAGVITPRKSGGRLHVRIRWGLIPNWWDKPLSELPSSFNARAETVASKPFFTEAFERRRCLVPASGFFEWTGPEGERQPWYITSTDGKPLTFAGLYDRWIDPGTGDHVWSFTIIVGEPNNVAHRYHDRMPVILGPAAWEPWLREPRTDLLMPCPDQWLQAWPVTPRMNGSRYEESDSVQPIRPPAPSQDPSLSP